MRRMTATLALTALFLVGCGDASPLAKNPKNAFEAFMHKYLGNLQTVYDEDYRNLPPPGEHVAYLLSKDGRRRPDKVLFDSCLYDVRKTDSLVQPYEGSITLKTSCEWKTLPEHQWDTDFFERIIRFGWQDGKWVPTTVTDAEDGQTWRITAEYPYWKAYERTAQ